MDLERIRQSLCPPGAYTLLGKISWYSDSSIVSEKVPEPGNLPKKALWGSEKFLVDRKVPRSHMEEVSSCWGAKADWAVDT